MPKLNPTKDDLDDLVCYRDELTKIVFIDEKFPHEFRYTEELKLMYIIMFLKHILDILIRGFEK